MDDEILFQQWLSYTAKGDVELFKQYLLSFNMVYHKYLDVDYVSLTTTGLVDEGPHHTRLPDGFLQTIDRQLMLCSDAYQRCQVIDYIHYAQLLTKALIITCRNLDNVALVASCNYTKHLLNIASVVSEKLNKESEMNREMGQFLHLTLHLLEVMYDPYLVWRRHLKRQELSDFKGEASEQWWTVDKSRCHYRPALLHDEVIPFFYECFISECFPVDIQARLFHMFGAIISGSQVNALKAICPATLTVLIGVLGKPFYKIPHNNNTESFESTNHQTPSMSSINQNEDNMSSTNQNKDKISSANENKASPVTNENKGDISSASQNIDNISWTNQNKADISFTNKKAEELLPLKELIIRCLVRMIHVIHCSIPEERQVEVGTVLEDYYKVLLELAMDNSLYNLKLQLNMISSIQDMLNCTNRSSLQDMFIAKGTCETLITYLHTVRVEGDQVEHTGISVIRAVSCLMFGSSSAKARFTDRNGFTKLAAALKALGPPTRNLLTALLDLVSQILTLASKEGHNQESAIVSPCFLYVTGFSGGSKTGCKKVTEDSYETRKVFRVKNGQVVLLLVQWLPELGQNNLDRVDPNPGEMDFCVDGHLSRQNSCDENDLQIWLSQQLLLLCSSTTHNRVQCCNKGIIATIIEILKEPAKLHLKSLSKWKISRTLQNLLDSGGFKTGVQRGNIVNLLELLGTVSISALELKMLLGLLKSAPDSVESKEGRLKSQLMHAVSVMARRDGLQGALHFFDLHLPISGIKVDGIFKWPGTGFSFHCWLCLEPKEWNDLERRQIYSFMSSSGSGFEAFLTAHNVLVIAVIVKREYHSIAVTEHPISDKNWHCIDIVHQRIKGLFSASHNVTVYINGEGCLTSPFKFPPISEPFSACQIGCVMRVKGSQTPTVATSPASEKRSRFSVRGRSNSQSHTGLIISVDSSKVDGVYGPAVSCPCMIASVTLFHEGLTPAQVKALYHPGANALNPFSLDDPYPLLLHYSAKAYQGKAYDLSGNGNHGSFTGQISITWDIKDVINSIGGLPVLFPLLENIGKLAMPLSPPSMGTLTQSGLIASPASPDSDWVVIKRSSYDDSELEKNEVAGFITLLRNMLHLHPINQDYLMKTNSMAVLGMLLQKVDSSMIDVHVLMALQLLVEAVVGSNKLLHQHIYHHLLFDFRIWSRSDFPVRIGHIQYLSTIIKEDRTHFRKKYGVQYLLDIIRTYYSNKNIEPGGLAEEDNRAIRESLFSLIRFYVYKEITADELRQILNFIIAVENEILISEALDLLLALLEGKRDQIYLLMFETNTAENLYMLLTVQSYSPTLKEKVLKVFSLLLRSTSVYEKSKTRIRIQESEMFSGLVELMRGGQMSHSMTSYMFEQVLATGTEGAYNAALSIIQLLYQSDIDTKLEATKKLLEALFNKPDAAKVFAKQLSWQDILVRLLIVKIQERYRSNGNNPSAPATPTSLKQSSDEASVDEDPETPNWQNVSLCIEENGSLSAGDEGTLMYQRVDRDSLSLSHSFTQGFSPTLPRSTSADTQGPSRSSSTSIEDLASPDTPSTSEWDYKMDMSPPITEFVVEGQDKSEELCQNVLTILYTILWKGVQGSDTEAWKERGQVLACISYLSESHELIRSKVELTRRLIEMMLLGSIMDLKETGQTSAVVKENSLQLLRIVFYFLCVDETSPADSRFTERIIEDVMTLLDLMTVFEEHTEWREMEQLGLMLLLQFSARPHRQLYSRAAEGLCRLVQQRPVDRQQEACYMMGCLHHTLTSTVTENPDQYSFLFPVMKALISKCEDLLNMGTYLPNLLLTTTSPNFFEDFKAYLQSQEWLSFINRQVLPSLQQYESMRIDGFKVHLKAYIGDCHEDMMVDIHKRMRQRGESKIKFQEVIVEGFRQRARKEKGRMQNVATQLRNQHSSVLRQWRATKLFFTGQHGAWSNGVTEELHWKLSNQENFSRMRPKLVPNHNFDPHIEASRLRDNQGSDSTEENTLASLEISKEAMVSEDIGDDRLGDEEWNVISSAKSTEELEGKEKLVLLEECELVMIVDQPLRGRLEVTNTHIYFFDCTTNRDEGSAEDFKLSLSQLREIHFRRYNLRRSALEIFLVDQTNYFLNFPQKARNRVYSKIVSLRPPNLFYYGSRSPAEMLKNSKLTEKWVNREISNFDYLMHLNTIAGRTYNDLSQYPVFPWILADYTSPVLDLEDPKSYRDLSKPIGVINPKNEIEVRDKYEHFEDPMNIVSKFHYGTHYSNPATVMHYLVRLEPFTTLHIQLQSDKFDVADRQFHSIEKAWSGLLSNPNDVKELIPEFFYLPDFLVNHNNFDLGRLQGSGDQINDVELPAWAESPEDFIDKHRQALESEYVSEHLHSWIDLIFGYKQKGKAAEDALNVFYYCTYEGAVDLDAIKDKKQRLAVEGMIKNFGQTPCQLLKEPHPKRLSFKEATENLNKPQNVLWFPQNLKSFYVEVSSETDPLVCVSVPRSQSRSIIHHGLPYSMIGITQSSVIGIHKWLPYDKSIPNYFTFERDPSTSVHSKSKKQISLTYLPNVQMSPKLFVASHDAKYIFSGGHWDNSLKIYSVSKNKTVAHITYHNDIVTCLALDHRGSHLMTGSRDMTCMVWEVSTQKWETVKNRPRQILYGHDSEVTCVAISVELDLAVSASKDHTVLLHTIHRGHYMRTLRPSGVPGHDLLVEQLDISDDGHIVFYATHTPLPQMRSEERKHSLHLYSVNGKLLATEQLRHALGHMIVVDDHLLMANMNGDLILKKLFGLKTKTLLPLKIPVRCLSVTNNNTHILSGLQDGKLIIITYSKNV